jgi:hypothetical protein
MHQKYTAHRPAHAQYKLYVPKFTSRHLKYVTNTLGYQGFIKKMKKVSLRKGTMWIDRPVMEACWVRLCRQKAGVFNRGGYFMDGSVKRSVEMMAAVFQLELGGIRRLRY